MRCVVSILGLVICIIISAQSIIINEVMCSNDSISLTNEPITPDWIELYNPTDEDVYLVNWSLSDDIRLPDKWRFPSVKMLPHSYLLVYASGQNRCAETDDLHTNFKLGSNGGFLGLYDFKGNPVSVLQSYPTQYKNVSYGILNNEYVYLQEATPATTNTSSTIKYLPPPSFSKQRGLIDEPFLLDLSTPLDGANIYYTTRGADPTPKRWTKFVSPILINKSAVVKAVTVRGDDKSFPMACSYIFSDKIKEQSNSIPGYPSKWGSDTKASYAMNADMLSSKEASKNLKAALRDIPSISLSTQSSYLFSHTKDDEEGGIYIYTGEPINDTENGYGFGWERPVSFEYFDENTGESLQLNCGVRLHGGHSRKAKKTPKHSFRLYFREEYGKRKLKYPIFEDSDVSTFNALVLRAGFGDAWPTYRSDYSENAVYIKDAWAKDTQMAMGYLSSHSKYVHLYLNGIYWGVYCLTERMDARFAADYMGGKPEDWDVIKDYAEIADGEIEAWNTLNRKAKSGLKSDNALYAIQGKDEEGKPDDELSPLVDPVNLMDYILLNFYIGNTDWDHHNWVAIRNRVNPDKGFNYLSWDAEMILNDVTTNVVSKKSYRKPTYAFAKMMENPIFKYEFADRVQKHCFNGGALSSLSCLKRWNKRVREIDQAIFAEACRWGDYQAKYGTISNSTIYTKEETWNKAMSEIKNYYFSERSYLLIKQLKAKGYFPQVNAPFALLNGHSLKDLFPKKNDDLSFMHSEATIYYTTNGQDPMQHNNEESTGFTLSPNAKVYRKSISLNQNIHIKARAFDNNEWSALVDLDLKVMDDYSPLRLTEISYHPKASKPFPADSLEFIEIKNIGDAEVDLSNLKFVDGINYEFSEGEILQPDSFYLIASSMNTFQGFYGFFPSGEYKGQLDNSGEYIVCVCAVGDTILHLAYQDANPWPLEADGEGYTLVPKELAPRENQNDFSEWTLSSNKYGSPFKDDLSSSHISFLDEQEKKSFVSSFVSPNPFTNDAYINLEIEKELSIEIELYNSMGLKIGALQESKYTPGATRISLLELLDSKGALLSGVYVCKIKAYCQDERVHLYHKIVKKD